MGGGGLHQVGSVGGVGQNPLGLPIGGVCIWGGWVDPPPPSYMGYYGIWSTSGRQASYWNAYLFEISVIVPRRDGSFV